MQTKFILEAIDQEILKLQQIRALLATNVVKDTNHEAAGLAQGFGQRKQYRIRSYTHKIFNES